MIDIRRLLDQHRVQWRDRGKNVSHNNLVIPCVYCNKGFNKDPGEHLSINYTTGEFFCYRNSKHKGFVAKLFYDLGIPRSEYKDLAFKFVEREEVQTNKNFALIQYFQPAYESVEAIDYLSGRFFLRPIDTIKKFHLLIDKEGKWAGRLIIPLTIGWTGRSMRPHIEPRYLAETDKTGFFLYRQNATTCVIVEGAVDAMRIASVSTQYDVIAKCRMGVSSAIINYLREQQYMSILTVPDTGVEFNESFDEQKLIRSYCTYSKVKRLSLPDSKKDFGEMDEHQTRAYLLKSAYA